MEPDIADGDDVVFFDKYGDQGLFNEDDDGDIDDDSFENGYYF